MLRVGVEPVVLVAKTQFASRVGYALAEVAGIAAWVVAPDADALRAGLRSFNPDIQRTRFGVV